jgi:iron complex transport system substrate-binding protein
LRLGIRGALLLLAGAVSSTACDTRQRNSDAPSAAALRVTDDAARIVTLNAPARRVICFMPAVTDMLLAIGAADRLIARTEFDTDPRIAQLPSTGNALTPSLEWVASLEPELVITWPDQPSRSVVGRLSELGIPVYAARTESIEDVLRTARQLGTLLGLKRNADSVALEIERALNDIRAAVHGLPPVPVAYVLSIDPPMIAGPGTFINELLVAAGGSNAFANAGALWAQVNIEEFIQRQPHALVLAQEEGRTELQRLRTLPGWRDLHAVRTNRVLIVDPYLFNRPGPSIPKAARLLAKFLHPAASL